jgi:hypothetical protein
MRLFATDLFRNFGVGFVLGAVLILGVEAESWSAAVASPAQAAAAYQAPAPADEFVIAPSAG